jgi:plasmid stability protein
MKNITVSVDDAVYRRARVYAAEQGTSVSAVVRELLQTVAQEETEFERLQRLEAQTFAQIAAKGRRFSGGDRMTREEAHDRNALR